MTSNPYASPPDAEAALRPPRSMKVRIVRFVLWSVGLSLAGVIVGFVAGLAIGTTAYNLFPSYYTDVLYDGRFGSGDSEKVRSIVTTNTAIYGAGNGFWVGLALPTLKLAWGWWRNRSQGE